MYELVFAVAAAGAVGIAGAVAPAPACQSLTPPWPLQAPLLDAALVEVPSLQVPVTAEAAGATDAAGAARLIAVPAAGAAAPEAAYQSLTPPCPLQAPLLEEALVEVPSLQVPVAAAAEPAAAFGVPEAAASAFFILLLDEVPMPGLADGEAAEAAAASDLLLVLVVLVEAGLSELLAAGVAVLASEATPYHFLIPSWPLHAPLFEPAEV